MWVIKTFVMSNNNRGAVNHLKYSLPTFQPSRILKISSRPRSSSATSPTSTACTRPPPRPTKSSFSSTQCKRLRRDLLIGSPAVWPDLAKIRHFGHRLTISCKLLRIYLVFGNILNLLWQNVYVLGKFSLLFKTEYWKIT